MCSRAVVTGALLPPHASYRVSTQELSACDIVTFWFLCVTRANVGVSSACVESTNKGRSEEARGDGDYWLEVESNEL